MAAVADPIVGRDAELAQIEGAFDVLESQAPACVAIVGEPGIGKSRLLRELCGRAQERGYLVLHGISAEFERDVPFGPAIDCLDAHLGSDADVQAWEPQLRNELAQIFPSLGDVAPGTGSVLAEERFRAHRAVRAMLERLAADRPLVTAFDDLHWADTATLELFGSLLRRGPAAPVLLAVAYRRGQAPPRLHAALASPAVGRIELGPLSDADSELVVGEDVQPRVRKAICRGGAGNPYYLKQLARAPASGALELGSSAGGVQIGGSGVPRGVLVALTDELGWISDAARSLLEAGAVLGEVFEADVACEVAGLSRIEGLDAIDELSDAELLRPTENPNRFRFRHALVQRAIYDATKGGRRLAAHASAAAALERRGVSATERAHHVDCSASRGDESAVAVLLDAARECVARSPGAAARWYEAALRLLPAGDRARRGELLSRLASALRSVGDLERCRAVLTEAIELATPDEEPALRAELTARCASVEHWLGRHAMAHRRLVETWERLSVRDGEAAAVLALELAIDGLHEYDHEQALELGARALEIAHGLGDAVLTAAAEAALSLCHAATGALASATDHRRRAIAAIDGLSDATLAPRLELFYHLAWGETFLERFDDALAHADRGLAISRATGRGALHVPLLLCKAWPLEMYGRLAEAVALTEDAVEAARLTGVPHFLFWALWEHGHALYLAGDTKTAIARLEESARVAPSTARSMPSGGAEPGWTLGWVLVEAGEADRGTAMMLEALGGPEAPRLVPLERNLAWWELVTGELGRGDVEAAARYLSPAERNAAELELGLPLLQVQRARAQVELASGDEAAATRSAQASVAVATAHALPFEAERSRALLGRALLAAGRREEGVAALREAERELERFGAERERDRARQALRAAGARVEPRGRAAAEATGLGSLTVREREIAELVCDRRTNGEIAAELFLSKKTVESHLRNLFFKLGVSSRVEVARAVERARSGDAG